MNISTGRACKTEPSINIIFYIGIVFLFRTDIFEMMPVKKSLLCSSNSTTPRNQMKPNNANSNPIIRKESCIIKLDILVHFGNVTKLFLLVLFKMYNIMVQIHHCCCKKPFHFLFFKIWNLKFGVQKKTECWFLFICFFLNNSLTPTHYLLIILQGSTNRRKKAVVARNRINKTKNKNQKW